MAGQSRMIFFSFSFSMTSFEVNYNADASSHFSWSHPNFFFLSLVVLKLMRRDFFHFYKQVRISASMFIKIIIIIIIIPTSMIKVVNFFLFEKFRKTAFVNSCMFPQLTISVPQKSYAIPSYFTIPKNYFINYTIPFYNISNNPYFIFFILHIKII